MYFSNSTILVACPGGAMTAGPEAIHQLVSDLIRLGHHAAVVYFPFSKEFKTPEAYLKYGAPVVKFRDTQGDMFIFPEIATTLALKIRFAQAAIWWMSVNNFTSVRYGYPWRDKLRYLKYVLKGLRPLRGIQALMHLQHFAQSYYALDFLQSNGIVGQLLSDPIPLYTSEKYLKNLPQKYAQTQRSNVILFNPHKGKKVTQRLREKFPEWQFFPLTGLNREQLADTFLQSKVYIDFGHHPGKDRLPREAAIHGCCVITGLHGSAGNDRDVNIPKAYKINPQAEAFLIDFHNLIHVIFADFDQCSAEFSHYRHTISQEQIEFDHQIINIFQNFQNKQ